MKMALITYGSKYNSLYESDHHFRSMFTTLPSVVLQTVIQRVNVVNARWKKKKKTEDVPSNNSSREVPQRTVLSAASDLHEEKGLIEALSVNHKSETPIKYYSYSVGIAEDNLINQKVLFDIEVDIVDNRQKAVNQAAVKSYDIISMDIQMPVIVRIYGIGYV
jgi:hypothetical protein